MATVTRRPMKVAKNVYAASEAMLVEDALKNKSAETFKAGEIVQIDATPEVIGFAAANLVNVGASDDRIDVSDLLASIVARCFGIAMKAAPSSGQIQIPVMLFQKGVILEGNLHEGANGASPTNHTAIAGDLYKEVGIVKGDDGIWYFTTDANEKCGHVRRFVGIAGNSVSGGNIGDVNAIVQVQLFGDLSLLDSGVV